MKPTRGHISFCIIAHGLFAYWTLYMYIPFFFDLMSWSITQDNGTLLNYFVALIGVYFPLELWKQLIDYTERRLSPNQEAE